MARELNETEKLIDETQTALVDEIRLLTETVEEMLQRRRDLIALADNLNAHLPMSHRFNMRRQFAALKDPWGK